MFKIRPGVRTLAPLLAAVGMAEAPGTPLDVDQLATEQGVAVDTVTQRIAQLEAWGLVLSGLEEGLSPMLLRAGQQYLNERGQTDEDVLGFLPHTFEDLNTRRAVLHAGTVLIDEFGHQLTVGHGADHAREIVPPAFAKAVTDRLALDLFAAAVALMARLSAGTPAGCVAEEIIAVRLIDEAAADPCLGRRVSRARRVRPNARLVGLLPHRDDRGRGANAGTGALSSWSGAGRRA
jgi:hypothetical protein